jgi:hypothetical protein
MQTSCTQKNTPNNLSSLKSRAKNRLSLDHAVRTERRLQRASTREASTLGPPGFNVGITDHRERKKRKQKNHLRRSSDLAAAPAWLQRRYHRSPREKKETKKPPSKELRPRRCSCLVLLPDLHRPREVRSLPPPAAAIPFRPQGARPRTAVPRGCYSAVHTMSCRSTITTRRSSTS